MSKENPNKYCLKMKKTYLFIEEKDKRVKNRVNCSSTEYSPLLENEELVSEDEMEWQVFFFLHKGEGKGSKQPLLCTK